MYIHNDEIVSIALINHTDTTSINSKSMFSKHIRMFSLTTGHYLYKLSSKSEVVDVYQQPKFGMIRKKFEKC